MTAAVYRWFLGLSGADLIVWIIVAAIMFVAACWGICEAWSAIRKRFGTWHDRWSLKNGPIKFEDRFP